MSDILKKLNDYAQAHEINTYSFSVSTENGIETLNRIPANPCQNCYSVAKVFCVTAIGMLFDEGKLTVDTSIGDLFAEELKQYAIPVQKWKSVTLDHVLRHEIGFAEGFLDIDTEDSTAYPTDDYLFMVLNHDLPYEAGKTRVYSDAAYYLISRAVTKISGEKLDDFLMKRLFKKINCREVAWSKCPQNYPIGATGLYLRTEDMVKLGRIYLDHGKWNGETLFSKDWIDTVLLRGYELAKSGNGYAKRGMRGQALYVDYGQNIAVAWHSFDTDGKAKSYLELL